MQALQQKLAGRMLGGQSVNSRPNAEIAEYWKDDLVASKEIERLMANAGDTIEVTYRPQSTNFNGLHAKVDILKQRSVWMQHQHVEKMVYSIRDHVRGELGRGELGRGELGRGDLGRGDHAIGIVSVATAILHENTKRPCRTLLGLLREIHSLQDMTLPWKLVPDAGLSLEEIETFPTFSIDNTMNNQRDHASCIICLSVFEVKDTLRTLPCLHMYHKDCIDPWLQSTPACPMCKRKVLPDKST